MIKLTTKEYKELVEGAVKLKIVSEFFHLHQVIANHNKKLPAPCMIYIRFFSESGFHFSKDYRLFLLLSDE